MDWILLTQDRPQRPAITKTNQEFKLHKILPHKQLAVSKGPHSTELMKIDCNGNTNSRTCTMSAARKLLLRVLVLQTRVSQSHIKHHQMPTIETSNIRTVMKPGPSQALVPGASSPDVPGVRRLPYVNSSPLCVINTWFNYKGELLCHSLMLLPNFDTPTLEESAVLDFVSTPHSGWRSLAGWGETVFVDTYKACCLSEAQHIIF